MERINVLFLSGIPNNKLVEVIAIDDSNRAKYIMTGSANVYNNIDNKRIIKKYQKLDLSSSQKINYVDINIIFNQIADADSHSKVLTKLDRFLKNKNIKVINSPRYVLDTSRNMIYSKLNTISNLTVPKTIKFVPMEPKVIEEYIKKHNFNFPVILRKTGTHGGESVKLLKSFDDIYKLYDIALDGSAFYLIQFIDYKENEIYKKFRLAVVDGKVYIRHAIFSENWIIHADSKNPLFRDEEIAYLNNFEKKVQMNIQKTIDQIYKRVKLDYFGMDCFISSDYKITLFELNANMNVLVGASKNTAKYVTKIKDAITEMIINKS